MFPVKFENEFGVEYHSTEQLYQLQYALYSGQHEVAVMIQNSSDGFHAKRLSKLIPGRNKSSWYSGGLQSAAVEAMRKIIRHKFCQNKECREYLISTDGLFLLEANLSDKNWGAGRLTTTNGNLAWGGKNWLGHILMDLRQTVASLSGSSGVSSNRGKNNYQTRSRSSCWF